MRKLIERDGWEKKAKIGMEAVLKEPIWRVIKAAYVGGGTRRADKSDTSGPGHDDRDNRKSFPHVIEMRIIRTRETLIVMNQNTLCLAAESPMSS